MENEFRESDGHIVHGLDDAVSIIRESSFGWAIRCRCC